MEKSIGASIAESSEAGPPRPRVGDHFFLLVYTFSNRIGRDSRERQIELADKRWRHWMCRLLPDSFGSGIADDDLTSFRYALDDTQFFLPHIRAVMFPETELLTEADGGVSLARLLAETSLPDLVAGATAVDHGTRERVAGGFRNGALRLTLRKEFLEDVAHLSAYSPATRTASVPSDESESRGVPFDIEWVDVVLLPHGVSLLCLKTRLLQVTNTQDLARFRLMTRYVLPPQLTMSMPVLRKRGGGAGETFSMQQLIAFLVGDLVDGKTPAHVYESSVYPQFSDREAQIYSSRFRLYGFVRLDRGEVVFKGPPSQPPFLDRGEQIMFELATGQDTSHPDWQPTSAYMDQLRATQLISVWQGWRALAGDNVVFLAEDGDYARTALAHNVENDYFNLFLLTIYQKVRLQRMRGELISKGAELVENLAETQRLHGDVVRFRNRYWWPEVTEASVGTHIYNTLQSAMDLQKIHRSISDELASLRTYFESESQRLELNSQRERERATQRSERLIVVVTVVSALFIAMSLVFVYPGLNEISFGGFGKLPPWGPLLLGVVVGVLVMGVLLVALQIRGPKSK